MNDKDLEMLVKIVGREQRYAILDALPIVNMGEVRADIQNTPCPDVTDVLKKWRAELAKNEEAEATRQRDAHIAELQKAEWENQRPPAMQEVMTEKAEENNP